MAGQSGLFARDFDNPSIIREIKCAPDGDTSTSAYGVLITLSYMTQETHSGRFFYASYYNAALGSGANLDIHLVTGATSPHIGVMIDIGGAATFNAYEGITTSANGTGFTIYNANRNSANVSNAAAYHTPTVTGTGTNFFGPHYIAGGSSGNPVGGSSSDFARITEFVLKPSTKYLFRATNASAGAVGASMQLGWFEDV